MAYSVLFDANVLHSMPLCDLILRLAEKGLFRCRWSREILDEVIRSVSRRLPDVPIERLERRIRMMNHALPDADISNYEGLVAGFGDRMGKDAHVLAAAVRGRVDMIVTANIRDFPADLMNENDIALQHPDQFLVDQWWLNAEAVLEALSEQSRALTSPPTSVPQLLGRLGSMAPDFTKLVVEVIRFSRPSQAEAPKNG